MISIANMNSVTSLSSSFNYAIYVNGTIEFLNNFGIFFSNIRLISSTISKKKKFFLNYLALISIYEITIQASMINCISFEKESKLYILNNAICANIYIYYILFDHVFMITVFRIFEIDTIQISLTIQDSKAIYIQNLFVNFSGEIIFSENTVQETLCYITNFAMLTNTGSSNADNMLLFGNNIKFFGNKALTGLLILRF